MTCKDSPDIESFCCDQSHQSLDQQVHELREEVERYEKTYGKSDYGTLLAERDAVIELLSEHQKQAALGPCYRNRTAIAAFLKEHAE